MSSYTEGMTLEQRLARIEAYIDIQNLMSTYAYYHTANLQRECLDLFALDTEGVWSEMTWGRYCGKEGLEKLYPQFHGWIDGDEVGRMHMHVPCQPVIEVAADCKTARGIWVAPGHETTSFMRGETRAEWCWMKYDCDFIVENGEWKLWHMRTPGVFNTPYSQPWTQPMPPPPPGVDVEHGPMMPPEFYPDEPPIGHNWEYATDRVYPAGDPQVPPRYATWSDVEWANRDNSQSRPVTPLARKESADG